MTGRYLELLGKAAEPKVGPARPGVEPAATPWREEMGRAIVETVVDAEGELDVQVPAQLERRLNQAWGDELMMTRVASELVEELRRLTRLEADEEAALQRDRGLA